MEGETNMVNLKNEYLEVQISSLGAELKSIKNNEGQEFLWQGNEKFWAGQAPVLFPITGGLKDDKYILDGKEYFLQKHGYARFCEFKEGFRNETSVEYILNSDEKSKESFPFDYELKIVYKLIKNSIDVKYIVLNKSNSTMYFSIGAHEGYSCPEGIQEYSIIFEKKETLDSTLLDGNLLEYKTERIAENTDTLQLDYKYFATDALIFENIKSHSVILKHNKSSKNIKVDFDGFDNLLFWTRPNAPYICIEPWCGIPDHVDSNYDITKKACIQKLAPGATFERTHVLTIEG